MVDQWVGSVPDRRVVHMSDIVPSRIGPGGVDHAAAHREAPKPAARELSADEARLGAAHAVAEQTLAVRASEVREKLGALDRSLSQFTAQGADLSGRVVSLLAPSSAL